MGTFAAHDGLIAGRYRLRTRIARGGMGTVWRATDELLAREVAVKELHLDGGTQAGTATRAQLDRTLREARAAALISHPNVVVLHDVVVQDGRPWIVMELVEGRTLSDALVTDGPVGLPEAARIGLALLGAVRAAHARGVLHRDIKPANVLLETGTGRVVLTDFGVAHVSGATTLTESGAFVGSPEFTAPERIAGGETGTASDLWSVGVLLCVALSGESPFRRDSLGGILQAVVHDEIRPPAGAGPLLPVVRGLLERDPRRRMGADEAQRLLRAYLDPVCEPGAGQRDSPSPYALYGVGSRARVALTAAVAVVALAGVGAGLAALLAGRDVGGALAPSGAASGPLSRSRPTPSVLPSPPQPPVSAPVRAPLGYRAVQDPAGFALAVPDGFTRSFEPPRIFYYSPGKEFRLGVLIQDPQPGGPAGALRAAAAQAPGRYPGYREATVTETRRRGVPAASWEFVWDGPDGNRSLRTYDICWDEAGKTYDVWASGPARRSAEVRRHLETALDTFVRIRPVSSP
ncbi:serine/threonine-protein kinase [Streptomyces albireticuli]|uniref:non-specific serine/threonine protein kinase n=1 Tax=Streptomyces albireticuli TaxID=1940 RepID=A0A2A2D3K4_9ACTN|nr:serine/threonine-protein kinase [Streptomyces albireticuli]MCD9142874.1 serine/threonine protein kinase [Streptomyces albireticuli]MCD9162807.1 serine/threonine protein kinase [Streptomyces albireticuli]MCD9192367.1 serine/threonine protein kinase [Streptomyces albireticuli]PAU45892.1 serine/threonine protein kinase [Streptomyces albireticuli]